MSVELIFIELLLGAMLLGFLGSYKKRIIDRAILLGTVPLAFILSIVSCKVASARLIGLLMDAIEIEDMPEALVTVMGNLIFGLASPFAAGIVFIVLVFVFRIVVGFILTIVHMFLHTRRKEKQAKKEGRKKPLSNKITTAVLGVVSGFLVCMFAFLPFAYINELTEPVLLEASKEEHEGTYMYEVAEEIEKLGLPFGKGSASRVIATATGMRLIHRGAIKSLTTTKVTLESGSEVEFNALELVNSISKGGVRLLAVYEKSTRSETTLADIKPAGEILRELTESELLMTLAADMLAKVEPEELPDDPDLGDELGYFVTTEYTTGNPEVIKNELRSLASLIELLATDMGNTSLEGDGFSEAFLTYMDSVDNTEKVIRTLSESTLYNTGLPMFMEFGLDLICDQMNLSDNKADDYERYLTDMQMAMADKSIGTYNRTSVDSLIEYSAAKSVSEMLGVPMIGYEPSDAEYAIWSVSYERFFERASTFSGIFSDYCVWDTEYPYYTYVTANGDVYYFFGEDFEGTDLYNKWLPMNDDFKDRINAALAEVAGEMFQDGIVPNPLFIAAASLAHEVNERTIGNPSEYFYPASYPGLVNSIINDLPAGSTDSETILMSLTGIDRYNAAPAYRDDIMNAFKKDVHLDERIVAENITHIASIYNDLTLESDEASLDTVMAHFADIGAMLDSFERMETTEGIPELMLAVIVRDRSYGKYFKMEPIKHQLDDVKNGTMSYEQLFKNVAELYTTLEAAKTPAEN